MNRWYMFRQIYIPNQQREEYHDQTKMSRCVHEEDSFDLYLFDNFDAIGNKKNSVIDEVCLSVMKNSFSLLFLFGCCGKTFYEFTWMF